MGAQAQTNTGGVSMEPVYAQTGCRSDQARGSALAAPSPCILRRARNVPRAVVPRLQIEDQLQTCIDVGHQLGW